MKPLNMPDLRNKWGPHALKVIDTNPAGHRGGMRETSHLLWQHHRHLAVSSRDANRGCDGSAPVGVMGSVGRPHGPTLAGREKRQTVMPNSFVKRTSARRRNSDIFSVFSRPRLSHAIPGFSALLTRRR